MFLLIRKFHFFLLQGKRKESTWELILNKDKKFIHNLERMLKWESMQMRRMFSVEWRVYTFVNTKFCEKEWSWHIFQVFFDSTVIKLLFFKKSIFQLKVKNITLHNNMAVVLWVWFLNNKFGFFVQQMSG